MSKSCLVVDDSKVIRKVARHILESMAFAVEEAADGQEALTFCRANRPDVILLDWNMPVMSGMEFLGAFNDLDYGREERSEEHTSELQSLMRISYAVVCLKKKKYIHLLITIKHTTRRQLKITNELKSTINAA